MKIKLARLSGQLTHRNHHTRVLAGLGTCYNILISTAIPEGCSQTLADSGTLSRFDFFQKKSKKKSDFNVKGFEMLRTNSNQSYF